jgi:hypothetical protein
MHRKTRDRIVWVVLIVEGPFVALWVTLRWLSRPLDADTACPMAMLIAVLIGIAWWWWPQEQRVRWERHGLCPQCGYDKRVTPGRCPECGWTVETV